MVSFTEQIGTLGQSQYLLRFPFPQFGGQLANVPVFAIIGSSGAILNDQNGGLSTSRTWFLDQATDSVKVFQGTNPFVISQSSVGSSVTVHLDAPISFSFSTVQSSGTAFVAQANAANPSWIENQAALLSVDLSGRLRTLSSRAWSLASSGDSVLVHLDAPISFTAGITPVTQSTVPWITSGSVGGSVSVLNFPTGFNVNNFPTGFNVNNFPSGFNVNNVPTVNQGTSPWLVTGSVGGTVSIFGTVNVSDTRTWTLNSGTDSVTAFQGGSPWLFSGSVGGSVSVLNFPTQFGVTQVTTPWLTSGSVGGTVSVLQGTSPWSDDPIDRSNRLLGQITAITQSVGVSAQIVSSPTLGVNLNDPTNPTQQARVTASGKVLVSEATVVDLLTKILLAIKAEHWDIIELLEKGKTRGRNVTGKQDVTVNTEIDTDV